MRDPSSDENTAERLSDRPGCLNEADEPSGGAMVTSNPFSSYTNSMCQDLHTDPYFLFRREHVSAFSSGFHCAEIRDRLRRTSPKARGKERGIIT